MNNETQNIKKYLTNVKAQLQIYVNNETSDDDAILALQELENIINSPDTMLFDLFEESKSWLVKNKIFTEVIFMMDPTKSLTGAKMDELFD